MNEEFESRMLTSSNPAASANICDLCSKRSLVIKRKILLCVYWSGKTCQKMSLVVSSGAPNLRQISTPLTLNRNCAIAAPNFGDEIWWLVVDERYA